MRFRAGGRVLGLPSETMKVNLSGQFATSGATLVVGWMLLRLQEERLRRKRPCGICDKLERVGVSRRRPAGAEEGYEAEILDGTAGGVTARGVVIPFPRRSNEG